MTTHPGTPRPLPTRSRSWENTASEIAKPMRPRTISSLRSMWEKNVPTAIAPKKAPAPQVAYSQR